MTPFEYTMDLLARGGPVMWPLLVCSLIAATVVLERLACLSRIQAKRDDDLCEQVFQLVGHGKWDEAVTAGAGAKDCAVRVLVEGLKHRDHGLSDAMQIEAEKQIDSMNQGMSVLDTIVTMTPLLGILGTVTGIIKSFRFLQDAGLQNPQLATGGISEALITTAAGLVIALVTLIPYNYLQSRIRRIKRRIEHTATQLEVAARRGVAGEADPVS